MSAALTDLTDVVGAPASAPIGRSSSRRADTRKETILSLVELLLSGSEAPQKAAEIQHFDDGEAPTVDEHLQSKGAEEFNKFSKKIVALDKELRNFANATRQLGSSAGILSSSYRLRERLAHLLHLYQENASDLFPRKISKPENPTTVDKTRNVQNKSTDPIHHKRRSSLLPGGTKNRSFAHVARPVIPEDLDPEHFPQQFEALAKDIVIFGGCLNEFPEFTDEAVNASIVDFEGDLKYWASCLGEYHGQFRYPAVQRYLHDLSYEMGDHIDSITSTISVFVEVGVPTIRFVQKHGATNLLNLSTVATFFSAVTATTMQFSYQSHTSRLESAVNTFWFSSLVFSIGAAVNSLLGLTWKQSMYRSPGHRVPWWVLIWIKRSPLVFLVLAVACFSVGLCLFAYSSQQNFVTSTITTIMTAFTSFGLIAVSTWYASEKWTFMRHRGEKWLSDVLKETNRQMLSLPGVEYTRKKFDSIGQSFRSIFKTIRKTTKKIAERARSTTPLSMGDREKSKSAEDLEANTLPVTPAGYHHDRLMNISTDSQTPRVSDVTSAPASPGLSEVGSPTTGSIMPLLRSATEPTPSIAEGVVSPTSPTSPLSITSTSSKGRQLWQNAIRTVKMHSTVQSNLAAFTLGPRSPHRQRTTSSTMGSEEGTAGSTIGRHPRRQKTVLPDEPFLLRSRVATLIPKLKQMEIVHDIPAHQALVRHLQFSPDGKYLATSSWDRTSVIFSVIPGSDGQGPQLATHRVLAHTKGFVGQVAWSPSGNHLLTKLVRGIKLWNENGVCMHTIDREENVESITWLPGGEAFLCVEGSKVTKLDLKGKVLDEYHFGKIKLHDVTATPDGVRLLGVGPLLESPTGLLPSKSRGEKRLVVFNTETKQIESQTPVLNDVRDVTLTQNRHGDLVALVSYEHKAPPQLWKLESVKDREHNSVIARLSLRHTYMPKVAVDFAGPSYFGGKNDQLILCAGKAGDIHIWDQESGALLHHFRAQELGSDLTCIAWNHAAEDPFMFATGSHDGLIRLWSKPPDTDVNDNMILTQEPSPFGVDDDDAFQRTDSPVQESENTFESTTLENLASPSGLSFRERVVAFAASQQNNA